MLDPNEKYLSGVTGRFQLEGADDMQATLKVTMSLSSWKAVREAIGKDSRFGAWQLDAMIRDMIDSATASAYARIEKDASGSND
jgi:hypothetical protein